MARVAAYHMAMMLSLLSMPMLLHAFLVPSILRGSFRSLEPSQYDTSICRSNLNMQNVEVEGRHELLLSRTQFARRTMACRIYSRMVNRVSGQRFTQGLGSYESAQEDSPTILSSVPTAAVSQEPVATTSEKTKSQVKAAGSARNSKSKDPEAPRDDQLSVAFNAFADSLLRLRGRVRFVTVNSAFRHEFPTLASEDRVLNSTIGRLVQTWYRDRTGTELNKTRSGVVLGLSVVNPSYTKADLRSLRAAQVLFEPGMRKKFDTLGLSVEAPPRRSAAAAPSSGAPGAAGAAAGVAVAAVAGAGAQRRERRVVAKGDGAQAEEGSGKGKGGWRALVVKNQDGKVVRIVRRADPEKGIGSRVLWDRSESLRRKGVPAKAAPAPAPKLDAVGTAAVVCVDAFAATALTTGASSTFADIARAFRREFPLLGADVLPDAVLGKRITEWHVRRYGARPERAAPPADGARPPRRADVPYANLGLRSAAPAAAAAPPPDTTLLNQAKVALRRALGMEGVGVLARRVGQEYVVFSIVPGSPAAADGRVRVGDVLAAVDGRAVGGLTAQELADLVLGPRGTAVRLALRGPPDAAGGGGEAREVELVRSDGAAGGDAVAIAEDAQRARAPLERALTR